jgi:hypothetical protein
VSREAVEMVSDGNKHRADSAQTTETVLTSKWQKAQTDYEELVIYNYGCLTKRKEREQQSCEMVLLRFWRLLG